MAGDTVLTDPGKSPITHNSCIRFYAQNNRDIKNMKRFQKYCSIFREI